MTPFASFITEGCLHTNVFRNDRRLVGSNILIAYERSTYLLLHAGNSEVRLLTHYIVIRKLGLSGQFDSCPRQLSLVWNASRGWKCVKLGVWLASNDENND